MQKGRKKITLTGIDLYSDEYRDEMIKACTDWCLKNGFGVARKVHTELKKPTNRAIKMFGNTIATAKFNTNLFKINIILHPAFDAPEVNNAILLNYE
nr:hypothetical protein [uncultured Draconibacterium sp.]